jgi:fatty acid desaturase
MGGFLPELNIPTPGGQTIPGAQNLLKAVFLVAAMLASFLVMQKTADAIDAAAPDSAALATLKWTLAGAMGVWNCLLLTGMGVLAHDAVHRVLFRNPFWNELGGGLLSALALIPFYANRQFHLTHHSYAHQQGLDPENEMHDHSFLYAATVGSVLALYLQYRNFFRSLLKIGDRRYAVRAMKDAALLSAAASFYFVLVPALGVSLALTVAPMMLALLPVFAWRALSDHRGIPPTQRASRKQEVLDTDPDRWEREGAGREREVTGWVVLTSPWLEWLWSHVNYHEVHHKYPWLSHAHLRGVFEATRAREPYLIVGGYWRSLKNISRSRYYETRERTRPFLSTPDW